MFIQKYKLYNDEPESVDTGNSGNSDSDTRLKEALDEIERLRKHSATVLAEKKAIQQKYKQYGDVDEEHLRKLVEYYNTSEDAKLIAEGKVDEVINKRTERIKAESEAKIADLQSKVEELSNLKENTLKKYQQSIIDNQIRDAAIKAGVLPGAIDDVLYRAKQIFSLGEDDKLEARDSSGNLISYKDKLLGAEEFIEDLKTKAEHYWPQSVSAGARGSGEKTDAVLKEAAQAGNLAAYRKLRKKQAL